MTDLRTLHDAFDELARRADIGPAIAHEPASTPPAGREHRWLAPTSAVAAVALITTAGAAWNHDHRRSAAPAARPTPSASTAPTRRPSAGSGRQTSQTYFPVHTGPIVPTGGTPERPGFLPLQPKTLAAHTRTVLAGTATIDASPGAGLPPYWAAPRFDPLLSPAPSVTSIAGTLTAHGRQGRFVLAGAGAPSKSRPACVSGTDVVCTHRRLANGARVAVSISHTRSAVTYVVEAVDPYNVVVVLALDNRGRGSSSSAPVPLTVDQMVAITTSDRW